MKSEFKIVVVASREHKFCYGKILPAFIRLIDVLHGQDQSIQKFKFIHNGTKGTLEEFIGVLNATQEGFRRNGFTTERKKVAMDVLMHGPRTEEFWVQDQLRGADAVFVIDDGKLDRGVQKVLANTNVYKMEVQV